MSDTPETLAAILAEMRREGALSQRVLALADRIEAAAKFADAMCRKNEEAAFKRGQAAAPGNAAALREALVAFVDSIQWLCDGDERGMFKKQFAPLLSEARAALAAPARNCDVGTAEEQKERFKAFCEDRDCYKCPFYGNSDCPLEWALAPFAPAEGGAE